MYTEAQKKQYEQVVKDMASRDIEIASAAGKKFAQAVEEPIRKVLLSGDIISGIFTPDTSYENKSHVVYMLDLLVPNQERDFYAYVLPKHGTLPERRVESDYSVVLCSRFFFLSFLFFNYSLY